MIQIGYKRYLGAAKKILGMEIHKDRGSRKLWLSQQGYVEKVLDRFGMSKAKPVSTPLANHFKLSTEQCPKTDNEIEKWKAHAIGQVCKYMSKPRRSHWEAVK
ncbi:hypothetical protein HRI_004509000 [Hibiscus trionum]|uniref:Reverse transcriptase Ty1/copia-type domain-containing protein n=1 Tax=Hibiscus trionum TaxID=183268 RepID=A0A9W7J8R4_HIBTR|nr:hypothetical protein HRI_004509000 [Hibiscus trionum]